MKNKNIKFFKLNGTTGMRGIPHLLNTLADESVFNEGGDEGSAEYRRYENNSNYAKYYINCHEHGSFDFEVSSCDHSGGDCTPYGIVFIRKIKKHDSILNVLDKTFKYFTHAMNGDFSLDLEDQELLNGYADVYEEVTDDVDLAAELYNESESYSVEDNLQYYAEGLKEVI